MRDERTDWMKEATEHAAVPVQSVHPAARPVFHEGLSDRPGVLLLHGLTASPTEVQPIAEFLRARRPDWSFSCPLLPGHGTSVDMLEHTDANTWRKAVAAELNRLAAVSSCVNLLGVSLGAVLAAEAALDDDRVTSLVMLAPIFGFRLRTRLALRLLRPWKRCVRKSSDSVKNHREKGLYSYDRYPIASLQDLQELGTATAARLAGLRIPVLVAGGDRDRYQSWQKMRAVAARISNAEVTLFRCENSGHVLPHEPDALRLNEAIDNFLGNVLARSDDAPPRVPSRAAVSDM